ncbi:MAG TPA: hypothetical protein VIG80_09335, partial [Bacillaceae bacterium]
MKRLKIRATCLLLFLLMSSLLGGAQSLAADKELKIKIDEGYNGKIKSGRGYPIKVTLTNDGPDFSGDMLASFASAENMGGARAVRIDLPSGLTKTYEVSLPGYNEHMYNPYQQNRAGIITVYEGDWKKGKKAKLSGKNQLRPNLISQDEVTIGLLSENPDRMVALKLATISGRSSHVVDLAKESVPAEAEGLDFFDYIVVDDFPLTVLSEEQQAAVLKWVEEGGILLAGGTAKSPSQGWGLLEPMLPLAIERAGEIKDLSFLTMQEDEKLAAESLAIREGTLRNGAEAINTVEHRPIVAMKQAGRGEVWQTSFSLGEEPLSSWPSYSKWLGSLLSKSYDISSGIYSEGVYPSLYHSIGSENELFSASQISPLFLVIVMVIYLILAVPVLYVILKKKDKREHAWWIIPALSVLVSTLIFGIGAKDRIASPRLAESGIFKADGEGGLNGVYAASILTNRGGDYQLSLPKDGFDGVPAYDVQDITADNSVKLAVIGESVQTNDYHFRNVEFWSTRSLVGNAGMKDKGQFTIDLNQKEKKLTGIIENQFSFDFEETFLWTGREVINLGPLKRGGTISVSRQLSRNFMTGPAEGHDLYSHVTGANALRLKKEVMADAILNLGLTKQGKTNEPIIFGFTKADLMKADLKGKKEKNERLSLIFQSFKAEGDIRGAFSLKNESLKIDLDAIDGSVVETMDSYNQIGLENGTYEVAFTLPEQLDLAKASFDSITFDTLGYAFLEVWILDQTNNQFVQIAGGRDELEDRPERFVSSKGEIKVKMAKNAP